MPKAKKLPEEKPAEEVKKSSGVFYQRNKLILVAGLLILIVALWLFKNPKTFLAAVVNNKPITTWQLDDSLQKKFGARLLDQMIDETLITNEAQKEGINVNDNEVNDKINELQTQVGGKDALPQLLLRQGLTLDDLKQQIKLKLIVDKILVKKVTVTDTDVQGFMDKNKDTLPATDSASQKKFAKEAVKQQMLSDAFQKWYQDLKSKAKIYKFF